MKSIKQMFLGSNKSPDLAKSQNSWICARASPQKHWFYTFHCNLQHFLYFFIRFFILFILLHCVFNDFAQNTVNYNGKYKNSIKSNKFLVTFATLLKSYALGCLEVSRSGHLGQAGGHAGREDAREREREKGFESHVQRYF